MKNNLFYTISICFLLLPILVWGQDPFYINYDTNDGLPSSEIYFAHADTNGLIWFATDRGVCTYDGYTFSTYTTKEGLSHNTNFRIFSDPKNRLWFTAFDGSLSVYEDGTFKAIPLLKDTVYANFPGYANQLLFDEEDNLFVIKNTRNDLGIIFRVDEYDFSVSKESIFDFKNPIWKNEMQQEVFTKIGEQYLFFDRADHFSINVALKDSMPFEWLASFGKNNLKYFNKDRRIDLEKRIGVGVHNFHLDPKNNLWLCTDNGLLLYENANVETLPRHFFKGLEVTSILMDREGSYWMTSREKGVFWIPSFAFHSLFRPKQAFEVQQILSIGKLSDFLLFGTVDNGVVGVDHQFNPAPQLKGWNRIRETKRMYPSKNTIYTREFNYIKEQDGKLKPSSIKKDETNSGFVKQLKNGLFFISNPRGYRICTIDESNTIPVSSKINDCRVVKNDYKNFGFNVRINCVEESADTLWIGGLDGLYKISMDKIFSSIPQKDTSSFTNVRVEDIICVNVQQCWIATIGNGVLFKNGNQYTQLLKEDGLSSDLINKIYLEDSTTLWVGTNKGLDKVCFREEGEGIVVESISNFSTADGLVSNFVNDLTIWKEQLWLATNKGINYFRPEELIENKTRPLIRLEEVLAGERSIENILSSRLKHNENNLVFNFLGVSFKKPKNKTFYRYRLKYNQEKSVWYYTDNRSIRFFDLTPGAYIFEVAARNNNGYWSKETASYTFYINAHFSDQLWFRIIVCLVLSVLIGAGFFYRIHRIKNDADQKRKLQDAELNGLRNQMNPHFIFNSLNSIQSFIFNQDVKQANYYLSKFSRLMRNSLEYSKLKYISIHEEVAFLRAYLELEQLRFDDRFGINFEIAPEILAQHCFIPPLLLQPILENSVKHAFKNIAYQGRLDIKFMNAQEGEMIQVVICDNGIGLKEDKMQHEKFKHQSMGLSIIQDRIKLLNPNKKDAQASFTFGNRYNSKKEIIGTQAHFVIPIKLMKND